MRPENPSPSPLPPAGESPVDPPEGGQEETAATPPMRGRARLRGFPLATFLIAALNTVIWLIPVSLSGNLDNWLGLQIGPREAALLAVFGRRENERVQAGEYWRLIAPIFLHAGLMHLAVNNLSLLTLGAVVERIFGPARFLVLYLFSGICGNIAGYEFTPHAGVGASGAIMGLAGVILIFALRHRRRLAPRFREQVRTVLLPLVLFQLGLGFFWPEIDALAHLGGFLGGCLLTSLTESRLLGRLAMEREQLPVGAALVTGLLLVIYTGAAATVNVQRNLPTLRAGAPDLRGRSVEALRAEIERQPGSVELRLQLALALTQAGRRSEAADVLVEAAERDPGDLRLWEAAAVALGAAERPSEAAEAYRRILAREPNNAMALNNLAYLYVDALHSNLPEALAMAQRAVKLEPGQGSFWGTLGWALFKSGRLREAAAAQKRAVELEGRNPEVRYHMGAIQEALGDHQAAGAAYDAALQLDPDFAPARAALARLSRRAAAPTTR